MSKFLNEFKEFAMRGNVLDMAVGVIIGGAFGKIVSSVVDDVIMPPIGWLIGGVNFADLKFTLPTVNVAGEKLKGLPSTMVTSSRPASTSSSLPSVFSCSSRW